MRLSTAVLGGAVLFAAMAAVFGFAKPGLATTAVVAAAIMGATFAVVRQLEKEEWL